MSFMLVKGKVFVCEECSRGIPVEYEGGEQWTQIGDYNIELQNRISQEIGKFFPELEGSYLYDFGICEGCYQQNHYLKYPEEETNIAEFLRFSSHQHMKKEKVKDSMRLLIQKITDEITRNLTIVDIETISNQQFDPYFGDKHSTLSKRKGMFKQWYQNYIRPNINHFIINCIRENEQIEMLASEFNQKIDESYTGLLTHFNNDVFIAFIPKNISDTENLNPYIQYENTVRSPVSSTPALMFYHKVKLSATEIKNSLKISTENLKPMMDTDILEKQFKEVLEGLVFSQ